MTPEAPQQQPAAGEQQVLLRLVKPEEADVVAKQVGSALMDIQFASSAHDGIPICHEQG